MVEQWISQMQTGYLSAKSVPGRRKSMSDCASTSTLRMVLGDTTRAAVMLISIADLVVRGYEKQGRS
jgi:hypothetical protein